MLADYFLRKYRDQYNRESLKLSGKALSGLMQHDWPGNIRELEHTIEKGVILSEKGLIEPGHLFTGNIQAKHGPATTSLNLEENEKLIIQKALRNEGGNVASSARKLGINRSTLYQKMKKYGL